jgi:hypothetical protein
MLFNSFFAFTNTKIGRIAKTGAEAIAGAAPYLIPVVQAIIELAFAGIETADDMKQIKAGYGVTIVKKPKYWKTFAIDGLRTGNNTEGVTLDYSEFLRIFLNLNMLGGKEVEKLARIADCIKVNTDFDMKNGYTMLAIEAKVKVRTTFMRKISDMGSGTWTEDSYPVLYQSVLGY